MRGVLAFVAAAYAAIMFVPLPTGMAAETTAPLPPVQKLCPDGKIIAYTAKCATAGTVKKVCPYGQIVGYTVACPTTPPAPEPTWTKCADEGGLCSFKGIASIRYGVPDHWVTRPWGQAATDESTVRCSNDLFGDPAVGIVKRCETTGAVVTAPPPPTPLPTGTTRKLCLPSNTTVPYATACPAGTTSTKKICPDDRVVAYTASCAAVVTPLPPPPPICPGGYAAASPTGCPTVPPPNPCFDNNGAIPGSWCPAKACPGVVNPVPAEVPCPAPVTGKWEPDELRVGGYAYKVYDPAGSNGLVFLLARWDGTNDADPKYRTRVWSGVYAADKAGNFPVDNPYWKSYWFRNNTADLVGVKPVQ